MSFCEIEILHADDVIASDRQGVGVFGRITYSRQMQDDAVISPALLESGWVDFSDAKPD